MPIKIEVLPETPIIITHYIDYVTAEEFKGMYESTSITVDEIIQKGIAKHVYRIGNTTGVKSDFMEVMKMAQLAASHVPGATGDPRITSILVGTEVWGRLFLNMISQPQFGSIQVPFFKTLEEALEFCQLKISETAQS